MTTATTSTSATATTASKQTDEDEEDSFGDLIGCQPMLRHQHHQRYMTHRSSLHIPTSPLTSSSVEGAATSGRHLLGIPEKYDRKLRRLSDPGGGIGLKGDAETRIRSPSGKLCDPRLEAIRSLSPSKASQAAGEEGEALNPPPPVLFACRSSRSKSVFQLPGGMFGGSGGVMGGGGGSLGYGGCGGGLFGADGGGVASGSGRSRSMSVTIQPLIHEYTTTTTTTPTKTRPDSPTPPTFFDQSPFTKPPKQLYPKPTPFHPFSATTTNTTSSITTTEKDTPTTPTTTIVSLSPTVPPALKLTPPPEPEMPPSCDELTSPSYHFRRRRSISLEGSKLEAILEENNKSGGSGSAGGRKMSLPDFENQ